MTDEHYTALAKSAYTIFRGADISDNPLPHWDDMAPWEHESLIFVAKFAAQYPK